MPNDLNQETLRHLASLGARARLEQIDMERRAILAAFPELGGATGAGRRGGRKRAQPTRKAQQAEAPAASNKRRRRGMSAAERKEVSERMKKYWAERRKAKAAKKG